MDDPPNGPMKKSPLPPPQDRNLKYPKSSEFLREVHKFPNSLLITLNRETGILDSQEEVMGIRTLR